MTSNSTARFLSNRIGYQVPASFSQLRFCLFIAKKRQDSLAGYFPALQLRREDILSSDAGVRPLVHPRKERRPTEVSRDHSIIRTSDGVYHVVGVKLTDHRRAAAKLVNRLVREFERV